MTAALPLLALAAHAQAPGGSYSAPAYSGGTLAITSYNGTKLPLKDYGPCGDGTHYGVNATQFNVLSGVGSAECAGLISTTFTWNNGGNANSVQPSAIVTETCTAQRQWTGGGSGKYTGVCDDGLGQTSSGIPTVTAAGTRYTAFPSPSVSVSVSCSPHVTGGSTGNAQGYVSVSYQATVTPVYLNLTGTTPDASGNANILVGQGCSANITGLPAVPALAGHTHIPGTSVATPSKAGTATLALFPLPPSPASAQLIRRQRTGSGPTTRA